MKRIAPFAAALALLGAIPLAAQTLTPQVTTVNPNDLFQDIVGGAPAPGNVYAPASLLGATFGVGAPTRGNVLIGGDATTNLWQRATAGAATTSTTPAYDGPDRYVQWSTSAGASVTLSRDSTAADLFPGFQYSFKLAHTNTSAGAICKGQEVASANSYQFAGQTAEFDFHAYLGAGYTGGATLTAYIVYGTGTDDGTAKMAYTVNGAGTSPGWAGGAIATAAVIPLSTVSTGGRFTAIAAIPATATEIGVALCYTAGTTDTNDYVATAGEQLVRNSANLAFINTGVGYNCTTTANLTCVGFDRRPYALEAWYQYQYYQQYADNLAATFVLPMTCTETTSGTTATCLFNFPVPLRVTPTVTVTTATSFGMTKVADGTAEACTTFALVTSTTTTNNAKLTCAVSETAAVGTMHIGLYANTGAANTLTVSAEL